MLLSLLHVTGFPVDALAEQLRSSDSRAPPRASQKPSVRYQYFLSVCSMIGTGTRGVDDGFVTRIARWVSWHAVVVDHFYLYLDGIDATFDARFAASVDGSASFGLLRDKAASQKSVRLGNWGLQQQRFAQCALVGKQTSEWMGFIDDDEFVVPVHGFAQMLRELPPPVDAIYMLWEMKCGNRSVTDRKRYRLSGKSFIKPVHFRDARHERTGMTTNGIIRRAIPPRPSPPLPRPRPAPPSAASCRLATPYIACACSRPSLSRTLSQQEVKLDPPLGPLGIDL